MINHLTGVLSGHAAPGSRDPIDFNSDRVRTALPFFKAHHTVIDPTASWGEMAGHTKDVEVAVLRTRNRHCAVYAFVEIHHMGARRD